MRGSVLVCQTCRKWGKPGALGEHFAHTPHSNSSVMPALVNIENIFYTHYT